MISFLNFFFYDLSGKLENVLKFLYVSSSELDRKLEYNFQENNFKYNSIVSPRIRLIQVNASFEIYAREETVILPYFGYILYSVYYFNGNSKEQSNEFSSKNKLPKKLIIPKGKVTQLLQENMIKKN